MSRWRQWVWLGGLLVGGGVLSPPFWSGVREAALVALALAGLTTLRELVRLAAGCAMGLRPAIVEIGEGLVLARFQTGGVRWLLHQKPIVSATIWEPPVSGGGMRMRLAVLAAVRPAATGAILLGLRAAGVSLSWYRSGAGPVGHALVLVAENLLVIGLVPFTIRAHSIVPFESDGMKLVRLLFRREVDAGVEFGRFYFAAAREALIDRDPARALGLCREGAARYPAAWGDVLRGYEATALARAGDHRAAMARAEAQLTRNLAPVARTVALNDWAWYAFLQRDEADRHLADRRSADAMLLKPDLAAVAGTRGAVLLWHGRVAEALPLLRRATDGAHAAQARDTNLCLLAMAWAAAGDVAQAQRCLTAIGRADRTEGLWSEAERLVRAASESAVVLRAVRGTRSIAVTGEGLELRQPGRVRRLAGTDIRGAEIGRTARGHAQIVIRTDLGGWRLPLADADLTWARMLFARRLAAPAEATPTVASAAATASLETQERAYQERARAAAVSSPKGVLFLGSLIASAAVMLASSSSWQGLGMVLPILFIHELGHWLAMRAFGHRDAQIAFIPMLGAATLTRTPFQKRWQEVVMLLAGPVPGIIGGIALCAVPATRHLPQMRSLALMAIGINVLNLLPLHPLDGGRILQALVTAGRPRLDLAFKTAAALLFVAGGFTWHDPLLGGLGVFGVIFWPQARRVAELERRIRQTPGFDPRLPAEQRRAYVFRALAHEPALQAKDWAGTVASLEGPLTYRPISTWRIAAGTLVVIVFGGGLLLGTGLLFRRTLGRRSAAFSCPGRTAAGPVRCGDPAALEKIAWQLPATASPPPATSSRDDDDPALAGFVWCDASDQAARSRLFEQLSQMSLAREYCGAYPWELPAGKFDQAQESARMTLSLLKSQRYRKDSESWNRALEQGQRVPGFDRETFRLAREIASRKSEHLGPLLDSLAVRLGPAPGRRCNTVRLANLRSPDGQAGRGAIAFTVTMQTARDFDRLGAWLCQAGCALSVLPADPDDPRVMFCR